MADKSFIGKGIIFLGPYADNAKRRDIGQVSQLSLQITEDVKELQDFRAAGGGKANVLRRVSGVECSISMADYDADNLALAVFGGTSAVTAGSISGELHTAYEGGLVRTLKNIDTTQTVAVTDNPGGIAKTGFAVTAGGITIDVGGDITDGMAIDIAYTSLAGNLIESLTQTGQEFKLTFVGLNEAQSGTPVVVDLHRVKFGPTQGMDFIGDEFTQIELTGEVLKDSAITTAGLSQFFKVEQA